MARAMSTEKIRALNDAFRTTLTGGKVLLTAGVNALPPDVKAMVIRRVATFSEFTERTTRTENTTLETSLSQGESSFSRSITTIRTWSSDRRTRAIRPRRPAS